MRQQQRGWLVAQCLPTLQLADLLRCEVVGNIAPSCSGHGWKGTPMKTARREQLSRLTLSVRGMHADQLLAQSAMDRDRLQISGPRIVEGEFYWQRQKPAVRKPGPPTSSD